MDHLIQFVGHHWLLCLGFLVVIAALFVLEAQSSGLGAGVRVTPQVAIHLVNRESAVVIDLQDVDAYRAGHIAGAKNFPYSQWSEARAKLDKLQSKPLILVDSVGQKAVRCAAELRKVGFKEVKALQGGLDAWRSEKLPLVKGNK